MQRRQIDNMIAEALKHINVKRMKKLVECDGDFKAVIELVNVCKRSLTDKSKKVSWYKTAKALYKRIMYYDPTHINFIDKIRKDGTWCIWLTWDAMTEIGTMSGYSLVSEHANSKVREDAAKSFVDNFCHEGPNCLALYNDPMTSDRQRFANLAISIVYRELGCPNTPEDVMDKLASN